MKHIAFCRTENKTVGNEQPSKNLAQIDADQHKIQAPSHIVTVISTVGFGLFVKLTENHGNLKAGEDGQIIGGPFVRNKNEFFHVVFKNDNNIFRRVSTSKLTDSEPV